MGSDNLVNIQSELPGIIDGTKSYMYEELWKMCAGPTVDLPKIGEQVYYFPQGHLELIEGTAKEKLNQMQSTFGLPSKFRCRVMDIKLKAEIDNDEVYAQITLISDKTQVVIPTQNNHRDRPMVNSFIKVVTASDTNGVLSIPIRDASDCLPPLGMTQNSKTQELIAKDLHGNEWKFKHSFKGSPQRNIITTGWSAFATAKKIVAGDGFVFLSSSRGETQELRVGIRRARHQQRNIASSLISSESMRHGILASAVHALQNNCMFTVIYNPRSSQFLVSYDKFMNAMNKKFNVGSRFSMRCEDNDFCERNYFGKIIGVDNFSSLWKDSEWRSLKVQWDDEFSPFSRLDKVSPWEIELITPASNVLKSIKLKNKRSPNTEIGSTSSYLYPPRSIQGQKIGQPKEIQNKQFKSTRSCTKVRFQGDAIGRALDLSLMSGYNQMIEKLENLFDLKGQLQNQNKWEIVFKDNKGDMKHVGDNPWPEFCNMVKKIFICSKDKVNEINTDNAKDRDLKFRRFF